MLVKRLSCVFWDNVLCSYRKDRRSCMMVRCWNCSHYKRFNRVMVEDEERLLDEVDRTRRTGVCK